MSKIYQRLLQNKFLILILSLSLIAFVGLYLADTYLESTPKLSEIIRSVAIALLTSYVVGFVFEYITRRELSDLISTSVHEQLTKFFSHAEGEENLYRFWRGMIDTGAKIIVPEDESGVEPVVRASDISGALSLLGGLMDKYGVPGRRDDISIDFVTKHDTDPDLRSFNHNLIVVGAPGANPMAVAVMKHLYHLPQDAQKVKNGYVYAADISRPEKYLENPFIVPSGKEGPGLLEIQNGKVITRYSRKDPSRRDGSGRDACLLLSGSFVNSTGKALRVLLIAGCSRFSTIDGVEFVMANENWAGLLPTRNDVATATVIETSISVGRQRSVRIARPPHPLE